MTNKDKKMNEVNVLLRCGPYKGDNFFTSGWGMFFHCNEKFNDERFVSLKSLPEDFDWKSSSIRELNTVLNKYLHSRDISKINLLIIGKLDWMNFKFRFVLSLLINLFKIKNFLLKKKTKLCIVGSIKKFKIFFNKIIFYKLLRSLELEKNIIPYKKIGIFENLISLNNIDIQYPLLLRKSTSYGGKDTYIINNKQDLRKLVFYRFSFFVKRKFRYQSWFLTEFIDTQGVFNYYLSFRVLSLNNKAYFIYPNMSRNNPITHVSEEDKVSKIDYFETVDFARNIFIKNKNLFDTIFKKLNYPWTALDFIIDKNNNIYFSEAEIKMGPSEKFIYNQIDFFELDENFFVNFREKASVNPYDYDKFFNEMYSVYYEKN